MPLKSAHALHGLIQGLFPKGMVAALAAPPAAHLYADPSALSPAAGKCPS